MLACAESMRALAVLHQPIHRFFPRFEGGYLPLREALDVFVEHVWHAFGVDPCRALHEGAIQGEDLFQPPGHLLIDFGMIKVGQQQHRTARVPCNDHAYLFSERHHFIRRAMAAVNYKDGLAFMFYEAQPVSGSAADGVVHVLASRPSTTP